MNYFDYYTLRPATIPHMELFLENTGIPKDVWGAVIQNVQELDDLDILYYLIDEFNRYVTEGLQDETQRLRRRVRYYREPRPIRLITMATIQGFYIKSQLTIDPHPDEYYDPVIDGDYEERKTYDFISMVVQWARNKGLYPDELIHVSFMADSMYNHLYTLFDVVGDAMYRVIGSEEGIFAAV